MSPYRRYRIDTADAPPIVAETKRFSVRINPLQFGRMVAGVVADGKTPGRIRELLASRPCIYGVYDSALGGLMADESLCRGCMRCMVEHPEVARIEINPEYRRLGDGYWQPQQVLTIWHEAATGRVPVRGAAYDGPFKGPGFDGIWTDMSEIVRPTRDGIHGREFISTAVDLGRTPTRLRFDGRAVGTQARDDGGAFFQIPIPILLEALPSAEVGARVQTALFGAAARTGTLCFLPAEDAAALVRRGRAAAYLVPQLSGDAHALRDALEEIPTESRMVAVTPDGALDWAEVKACVPPGVVLCVELPFAPGVEETAVALARADIGCLYLRADLHGCGTDGRFITDWIRLVHDRLVEAGVRERVTVIAGGGIIMAEHVPKAILCGADAVVIIAAALVALQCSFSGERRTPWRVPLAVPEFDQEWGVQRLVNLLGAWHSQLIEVLSAMGMREVRRLRGDVGRAIFADEIEAEVLAPLFENGDGNG